MAKFRARGSTKIDFGELTPDDFERVCHLIVATEFSDVVRLTNPDGGIEFGLPGADGDFVRCWQAKRYTGGISWAKCEASLDTAVKHFGMRHYTFCFPFDLTVGQHKTFRKRLGRRHEGVKVDYWNHSKLESVLLTTAQGERITSHFYEDRADNVRRFMEAYGAGGPMESGADVFQRLDAIAEFLATNDPYYKYVTVTQESGVEGPGPTPSTIVSLEVSDGQLMTRIDAIPRNAASLYPVPEGKLWFDDTPKGREDAEKFHRVMQHGGDLRIEDARFEIQNLPPLLESLGGGGSGLGTFLLRAPRRSIPPWDARFVIDTDRGRVEVDVLLEQCDAPDGWDAAVVGSFGGLTVMVMFRAGLTKGTVNVHWSYGYTLDYPIRDQALALAAVDAIQGVGKVQIEDRDGPRPTSTFTLTGREVDMHQVLLRRFMESLVTIEDWTGHRFTLPDLIPEAEVRAAIEAAQVIRAGESAMTFDQIELVMPPEKYAEVATGPGKYAIGYSFGVVLLGDEVWIGELCGEIPEVETETGPITEDGEEMVRLVVRPTTEAGRKPTFKLFPPHPALAAAASLASDA